MEMTRLGEMSENQRERTSKTRSSRRLCQILVPTLSGLGVQATTEEVCNFAELC